MAEISNQELTKTTKVKGLLSNQSIGTLQESYPLTALDFEFIQNGKSQFYNVAIAILLASFGYGLGLLQKFFNQEQTISNSEYLTLAVGIIIPIIIYIIGYLVPNKRKKLMNKIRQHFDNSPTHQFFTEKKQ